MIRDRMKPIAGGVNFWPHRSLIQFRKVNIVQVLLNKYFVLVFIAYFLLRFCFVCFCLFCFFFFRQPKTLFPPNPWICSAARRRTNIEPKRIHPRKIDISLLKTWFFFNFDQRPKNTKAIRIKVLHEDETLTINSPYRTSAWLVESPRTNLVPRAFPLKTHFLREKPWGQGWPRTRKRETSFKSNPGQIPAQSNTRFEIRLMPRLPQHNIWA